MTTRKDRKRYSREYKIEAVRRSYESGKPVTEVARELDLSVHHLYRWRDEVRKLGENVYPGHGSSKNKSPEKQELEKLRRENKRLQEERDILKKTLVYFASDQAKDISSSENSGVNTQ